MSLYRKKGNAVWYAQVYVKELGKCVCFSTKKRDEAEAREVERIYRAAHNREIGITKLHAMLDTMYGAETVPAMRGIPLTLAFDKYVQRVMDSGNAPSAHTLAARHNSLNRLIKWRDANYPSCVYACEVTRSVAAAFANYFNAQEGLSDKSKREGIGDLGTVWNVLMGIDELIGENPWHYFRKAVTDSKGGNRFSDAEIAAILKACKGTEWHTACEVSLWTGLRFGDVSTLTWDEVSFDEHVIRRKPRKTLRHDISVVLPLSEELEQVLKRIRKKEGPLVPELCRTYPHPERSHCGAFKDVLAKAKVTGHRFHDFRHTFASRLADAGVSTDVIKKLGGWNVTTTALHYQHSERMEELRSAIRAIEQK